MAPKPHFHNDNRETDCTALKETVSRLSFWILQIYRSFGSGGESRQGKFSHPKVCREIDKLTREIGDLQEKCKECHSKNPGGDPGQIPALEKGVESLERGLNATIDRTDQVLSHQKKDHAKIQDIQQALDCTRDELAAWAVYLQQQQQQLTPQERGETPSAMEEPYQAPTTMSTEMANKGDIEIEVTDTDNYPAGKFIAFQESLIYLIQGKRLFDS